MEGDTLSDIAHKNLFRPLYGENGSLSFLIQNNPQINNPDLIYPDQMVYLDQEDNMDNNQVNDEEKITHITNAHKDSSLTVSLGGHYDSLHEKDNDELIIVSKLQPSIILHYNKQMSSHLFHDISARYNFKEYEKSNSDTVTLENKSFGQYDIAYGLKYLRSSWFNTLSLGVREAVYYSISGSALELNKTNSVYIKNLFSKDILKLFGAQISLLGHLRYSLSADKFQGGPDYGFGAAAVKSYGQKFIKVSSVYQQGDFEADDAEFQHRWLDIAVTYGWLF
jgi:hypothetical protein